MPNKQPLKVHIVHTSFEYAEMFRDRGWQMVYSPEEADLIQFTGGADVHPSYYGETLHPTSRCMPVRDQREEALFKEFHKKKHMAGICRGGQFLNVMCGGRMYQHHSGHPAIHSAKIYGSAVSLEVSSTHHQLMIPNLSRGKVAMKADEGVVAERMEGDCIVAEIPTYETEAVMYADDKVLCFQPHPEFAGRNARYMNCQDAYFSLLKDLMDG